MIDEVDEIMDESEKLDRNIDWLDLKEEDIKEFIRNFEIAANKVKSNPKYEGTSNPNLFVTIGKREKRNYNEPDIDTIFPRISFIVEGGGNFIGDEDHGYDLSSIELATKVICFWLINSDPNDANSNVNERLAQDLLYNIEYIEDSSLSAGKIKQHTRFWMDTSEKTIQNMKKYKNIRTTRW